jgi:hypothetical protein
MSLTKSSQNKHMSRVAKNLAEGKKQRSRTTPGDDPADQQHAKDMQKIQRLNDKSFTATLRKG